MKIGTPVPSKASSAPQSVQIEITAGATPISIEIDTTGSQNAEKKKVTVAKDTTATLIAPSVVKAAAKEEKAASKEVKAASKEVPESKKPKELIAKGQGKKEE